MAKKPAPGAGRTLSIDFGTTTVLAAVTGGDGVGVHQRIGPQGSFSMPSIVEVRGGTLIVGEKADPAEAQRSVKSDITHGESRTFGDRSVSSDDLMAAILKEAVARTGVSLGADDTVRLGCPASWDRPRRDRLRSIARSAGLENVNLGSIHDEATSAGVSWIMDQWRRREHFTGNVLVIDLGGGTADVALLSVESRSDSRDKDLQHSNLKVLSAQGSGRILLDATDETPPEKKFLSLGGDDVDKELDTAIKGANPKWSDNERLLYIRQARETLASQGLEVTPVGPSGQSDAQLTRAMVDKAMNQMLVRLFDLLVVPTLREALVKHRSLEAHRYGDSAILSRDAETSVGGEQARQAVASGWPDPRVIRAQDWPLWGQAGRNIVLVTGGLSRMPQVDPFAKAVMGTSAEFVTDSSLIEREQAVASGLMQYEQSGIWSSLALPSVDVLLDGEVLHPSHTPVYDHLDVLRGTTHLGAEFTIPADGRDHKLEVQNPDGTHAGLAWIKDPKRPKDKEMVRFVPVRGGARIKFYATGHIVVVNGGTSDGRYDTDISTPGPIVVVPITGTTTGETPGEPG